MDREKERHQREKELFQVMSLHIEMETLREVLLVRLQGELDHHTAETLRNRLDTAIKDEQIRHVVLDLEDLTFMDSSGIGVILGRYKQITARSGEVFVCSINPTIYRIFEMSGLFKVLKYKEHVSDALDVLGVA